MGKVVMILFLGFGGLFAQENPLPSHCSACHEEAGPPLTLIYRRYLMLYSSKERIRKRMIDFLIAPSKEKSALPEGMKNRFKPQNHPAFSPDVARKAVTKLIENEDLIPRIVVPKRPDHRTE